MASDTFKRSIHMMHQRKGFYLLEAGRRIRGVFIVVSMRKRRHMRKKGHTDFHSVRYLQGRPFPCVLHGTQLGTVQLFEVFELGWGARDGASKLVVHPAHRCVLARENVPLGRVVTWGQGQD